VERWPWPFRIFTLGQFEIVRDSGIVTFSGKVQQKPVLLLKALIAFGGRQVNHEQLCEALWPDAEGDLAHRSFETTLYRLRQLIGKDAAIHLHDGRLTLDMQTCWVDAFALEQILEEAEGVWESSRGWREGAPPLKDQTARAIQLTGAAISLYKGHFLSTETELPWMHSPRERLRARFMRGIDALVRFWVTLGDFETAIRCCEKALEVNDLAEEFYQHLIICQRQLGRHANAVAIYNRCRSVLKARLGIEPSVQTESLIREFPSARSRQ
jgi:DNA-binding SARP family transcriptional activator